MVNGDNTHWGIRFVVMLTSVFAACGEVEGDNYESLLTECSEKQERPCGSNLGECSVGEQVCSDGVWEACKGVGPTEETCDGKDNDCDGDIDEGCACRAPASRDCGLSLGECRGGKQTCEGGEWKSCDKLPAEEACDGKDNDCDGDVDETCRCEAGASRDCSTDLGECSAGTQKCQSGVWEACSGVGPDVEGCDGKDNDCDGDVDEGCECVGEASRPCGSDLGSCTVGVQTCVSGYWSACDGERPASETCDGEDNDCDGDVDEGCECVGEASRPCGSDLGSCTVGVQTCQSGYWSACDGEGPASETCDGEDNDCDSDVDEGCECEDGTTRSCGNDLGECVSGVQTCADGMWGSCEGEQASEVEACNAEDDDCDGDVDEGCECEDGTTRSCGSDVGECVSGVQACAERVWGSCEEEQGPEVEGCDGEDNDCDGDVDEGCECEDGATRACGSSVGTCETGVQRCVTGTWGECEGGLLASPEVCDHEDNDCDGGADNGFEIGAWCASLDNCPGTVTCAPDRDGTECVVDEARFGEEICDQIDNDCDGLIDLVVDSGSLVSPCECRPKLLMIGDAVNASLDDPSKFCWSTQCGGETLRRLSVDGACYPVCQTDSDPDGDGWGWEGGATCIVEDSPRGRAATPCDGDEVPKGMAISYCLDCSGTENLPFAMCQSIPRFDLRAFGRGELWLRVDYTYLAAAPAPAPVNLWFDTGDLRRKRLPLVSPGDVPDRYQRLLRVEEACFTASDRFGSECSGQGEACAHCGSEEVCGAIDACGEYDLGQAWLQVAAEFCGPAIGQHAGTVTIHQIELIEPECE